MTDDPRGTALPEFDPELIEESRLLFTGPCDFVRGVTRIDDLPEDDRVEVAFAGRSNVGKSSLLNALTNRTSLARTSNTPGRTQELNFFAVGARLHIVDMPGYGYAKTEKAKVWAWQRLIRAYLAGRPGLKRVFVLIDARHGIKPNDEETMELMDTAAVSYQVVMTKADKPSREELALTIAATAKAITRRPAAHPVLHVTSAAKGLGLDLLRAEIAGLVRG
jgi:GTP-binding protein